jgi:large subunit ribosomal protein L24
MNKKFSTAWKGSKSPRKQRKYRYNAPLHIRESFLTVHLSRELAKKHKLKRLRVRTGDKVKILRGKFKGRENKVESISLKESRVMITGVEVAKKDGSKSKPLIHASNLLLTELNLDDKKRLERLNNRNQQISKSTRPVAPAASSTDSKIKSTNTTDSVKEG